MSERDEPDRIFAYLKVKRIYKGSCSMTFSSSGGADKHCCIFFEKRDIYVLDSRSPDNA